MAPVIDSSASAVFPIEAEVQPELIFEVIGEFFWLAVGFAVIHVLAKAGWIPQLSFLDFSAPKKGKAKRAAEAKARPGLKALAAASAAESDEDMVAAWDAEKAKGPIPMELLTSAAQSLAQHAPGRLVGDVVEHLASQWSGKVQASMLNALVEAVAFAGRADLASELADGIQARLQVKQNARTQEILMKAFAIAGDDDKVAELEAKARDRCGCGDQAAAVRAHATAVRALLRAGSIAAALDRMGKMCDEGLEVPHRAFAELFQAAHWAGRATFKDTIVGLGKFSSVPMDTIAGQLTECLRAEDYEGASLLEGLALKQDAPMTFAVFEPLLKVFAKADASRASKLFKDLQESGFYASEGLCGSLMARSGEAGHIDFAEEVAAYLRSRSMMTLATYKTLMKVYATNGLYSKACDLHEDITADGIEPDQVMYGCLSKFAARVGRTEISNRLHAKRSGPDPQTHIWSIRGAARDGDADKAMELLRRAESASGSGLDVAVYNATLDACATAGALERATELLQEMVRRGLANRVSYNTVIKCYCAASDRTGAWRVLNEMSAAGVAPDSASYNSILGAAVDAGSGEEPHAILREMDKKGVAVDHYTISIMMKAAKRARNQNDASLALSVLDRAAGVSVCEDEVVFNSVLDACIGRRDTERLAAITREFSRSSRIRPSVQTYGLLIKAFGLLRQYERCRELWTEMVEKRSMTPTTIALSCMLDALCGAGRVEEAVALMKLWKDRVPPNTVMYSTLIKGFTTIGDVDRASDMHRELHGDGLEMNLVTYTALIDTQVRAGNLDRARALFQQMQDAGVEPNVITYSTLAKGHCVRGDMDEALRLFSTMLRQGLAADTVIFNTLLDGCVKHSRFELADQLLEDMGKCAVEPSNFTISIIVKLWGKRRRLDKAFQAVRRGREARGCNLDAQVGACLISACFHNHDVDRVDEALAEIRSWPGCAEPDASIFNALVGGFVRCGELRRAVDSATQACEATILGRSTVKPLNAECIKMLFKALQQQNLDRELGVPLAQKLRLARMPVPGDAGSTEAAVAPARPLQALSKNLGMEDGRRMEPSWRRPTAQKQQTARRGAAGGAW
mmetsp:Transcript_91350/g.263658  ORF Transcript_91350/g.263658 Transcript_91350/m.263658 type:complete len:1086 (-) Transcript_91350:99-3356(-)